ncbi:hypothetical protein [Streptomyces sp. RerS4]|nr:hypothetical protein [Streptomyces sp. RerS4]UQW99318.1 hypothetical protein M4D82_01350 [Streptomyces sp. RerS4]
MIIFALSLAAPLSGGSGSGWPEKVTKPEFQGCSIVSASEPGRRRNLLH